MDMCWGFFPGTKRMPTPLLRAVKLLPGIGTTRFQHDSVDSEDIVCWQRGDSTAQEPCQGYPAGLPDRLFKLGRGHAYPIIHCSAEGQFEAGERLRKLFQTMILRSHLLSTSLLAPFRPWKDRCLSHSSHSLFSSCWIGRTSTSCWRSTKKC